MCKLAVIYVLKNVNQNQPWKLKITIVSIDSTQFMIISQFSINKIVQNSAVQFPPQLILFQTQRHLHLVLLFLILILIQLVQLIQRAIPPSTNFVTNTAAPFSW